MSCGNRIISGVRSHRGEREQEKNLNADAKAEKEAARQDAMKALEEEVADLKNTHVEGKVEEEETASDVCLNQGIPEAIKKEINAAKAKGKPVRGSPAGVSEETSYRPQSGDEQFTPDGFPEQKEETPPVGF